MDITPRDVMALSLSADCSIPTVRRFLSGKTVRPSIRQRIEKAVAAFEAEYGALARAATTPTDLSKR